MDRKSQGSQDYKTINRSNDRTLEDSSGNLIPQSSPPPQTKTQTDKDEQSSKKRKYFIIGGVILLAIILIIVLSCTLTNRDDAVIIQPDIKNPPPPPGTFQVPVSPENYQEFNPYTNSTVLDSQDWFMNVVVGFAETQATKYQTPSDLHKQFAQKLSKKRLLDPMNGRVYQAVDPMLIPSDANNQWASQVEFSYALIDNYQAVLNITDINNPNQYKVPGAAFERPVLSFEARFTQVGFQQKTNPYSFSMGNIYNNETLFSTTRRKLVVSEKYSEIGFNLPTNRVFGLGQHNSMFQLTNGTYTLWAQGRQGGLPVDNAEGGLNGPHIHPFLLCQTQNKDFFGMFFAGSAAMAFEIIQYPDQEGIIFNYISLGGQLEMYFIMRGTADEIIQKYHALIGYSMVPPYYALGYFQGSNAYNTSDSVMDVLNNYNYNQIALEGIFIESYTKPNQPFTVNKDSFQCSAICFQDILDGDQHVILGIDSGLDSQSQDYQLYDQLVNVYNATIQSYLTKDPLQGLQSTQVVFPDFWSPDFQNFLENSIYSLQNSAIWDGLYLKDNQFYSFSSGEVLTSQTNSQQKIERQLSQTNPQTDEEDIGNWPESYLLNTTETQKSTYYLPFNPGYFHSGNLDNNTLSLNATHVGSIEEYFVHNLNGHIESKAYYSLFKNISGTVQNRPLFFSDSTWAGSGAFTAVSLSNMWRNWENLRTTVAQAMSFSMYGISNVATEMCGSLGQLDEELCGRWAQLGAFLPLMRNFYNETYYNTTDGKTYPNPSSELYIFSNFTYEFMASAAINQRLQFSRFMYSEMYKVYRYGGSLIRPLFFDYPNDDNCFKNIEDTFMVGETLKVSPVLDKGVTDTYDVYFPEGNWADLNNLDKEIVSTGQIFSLNQSAAYTNIHLKAGKIIPFQENTEGYRKTKNLQYDEKMSFIIYRDASQYADGNILIDDGIGNNTFDNIEFAFWKLRYAEKSINFWLDWGNFSYDNGQRTTDQLEKIQILQAEDISNTDFACYLGLDLTPVPLDYSYNPYTNILTIKPEEGSKVLFKDIGFIKFGSSHQEPNFCDKSSFAYNVTAQEVSDTTAQLTLKSYLGSRHLEDLVVSIKLLDNEGSINLNITSQSDFDSGLTKLFKPPYVTNFDEFDSVPVTAKLSQFMSFTTNPFQYSIFVKDTPESIVYQSDPNRLYFSQYLIFDGGIFSMNSLTGYPLMGMGEKAGSLFFKDENKGIHSRYSFDQANPIDDGLPPGKNMYGFQPFYMYQTPVPSFFSVFDLNSYATDYILDFNEGTNTSITKISIGGSIQKYFFSGAKPDDVIKKYSMLVGRSTMPPLFSFGWQQCRFGWQTDNVWYEVVQNYTLYDLPLDTMWADIDYMDDYKIFTVSQTRYPNLATNVTKLHERNMTFVPIMDVGVAVRKNDNYTALDYGLELDIFIKQSTGIDPLTAGVWCGNAYFPDFSHNESDKYWHSMFDSLKTDFNLTFDGIWIDMNEATNFCNGYCITSERPVNSLRNKPYYVPGWRDLEDKALGVDGLHQNGWHEYDMHSMFSLTQVKSTSSYLSDQGLRPFVLSRSNFPGMSKFGTHWMGDNWSTVEYMAASVDGIYSYNLFGFPFMGSDICGFDGDAAADLCARYHQLGSLYPFARNHNQNATTSQEPYRFDSEYYEDGISYTDIIRIALRQRYSLIKYYYSNFWNLFQVGGSFFKPLFYEWPNDPLAYTDIQINILLGEALKVSIQVTDLNKNLTEYYFPDATWCSIYPSTDFGDCSIKSGYTNLSSKLTDYQIHMRSGYIVPYQDGNKNHINTTHDLSMINTDLYIVPNATTFEPSSGYLYYDDGVNLNSTPSRFDLEFSPSKANTATLTITESQKGTRRNVSDECIGTIYIMNINEAQLQGVNHAVAYTNSGDLYVLEFNIDSSTNVLSIIVSDVYSGEHLSLYDIAHIDLS